MNTLLKEIVCLTYGYSSDESLPKMRRLFPSYRLIRIPNAGHWVHAERPQDFLNCVLPELEVK